MLCMSVCLYVCMLVCLYVGMTRFTTIFFDCVVVKNRGMTEISVKIGHSLTKFRKQSFSLPKTLFFEMKYHNQATPCYNTIYQFPKVFVKMITKYLYKKRKMNDWK